MYCPKLPLSFNSALSTSSSKLPAARFLDSFLNKASSSGNGLKVSGEHLYKIPLKDTQIKRGIGLLVELSVPMILPGPNQTPCLVDNKPRPRRLNMYTNWPWT